MDIKQVIELSMVLDHERFQKVFKHVYSKTGYMEDKEDEYIDRSLEEKGMIVTYRDSQYKKKIRVIINTEQLLNGTNPDSDKIVRKIDKRIREYFTFKYSIDDFFISGVRLATDINVSSCENVLAYLKVFQRIGKVKGFSKVSYEFMEDIHNFCLSGNSNGVEFMIYDLEALYKNKINEYSIDRKKVKEMIKNSEGILRAEVWLTKPKTIRTYTNSENISKQIIELSKKCQNIFLDSFMKVVPIGNFYKKDKAEEIIRSQISDIKLRRRMLRLVILIPEKRSLYLAQKALNYRNIEKIMKAFMEIDVSPVTISKRHNVKYLENIYKHMMQ